MRFRFLLAAATVLILACCVVYAASESVQAPFTVLVVPNNPTVPAQAAAAGFTTQVLSADFTVPGNFWSNTSSYITNCGAAASVPNQPASWHFSNVLAFTATGMPCADTAIVTDPTFGGQVLQVQIKASEWTGSTATNGITLAYPGTAGSSSSGWLPNEIYTKIVARVDTASWNGGTGQYAHYDWWSTSTSFPQPGGWFDLDFSEIFPTDGLGFCGETTPSFYAQINEWTPSRIISNLICKTDDPTQFHTIESLSTSDESTVLEMCIWWDGTFGGCTGLPSTTGGSDLKLHDRQVNFTEAYANSAAATIDAKFYIKSMTMYSCAAFATQTCPGTVVNHWPFP